MGDIKTAHRFFSEERNGIKIDGVCDVISFDERSVVLDTTAGSMAVEGENLHITILNIENKNVEIEGKINAVYYFDNTPAPKKKLFGRG